VIVRRLRDKQARGEPITIESFVIGKIKGGSELGLLLDVMKNVSTK